MSNSSIFDRVRCSVHHGIKENYLTIDKKTFQVLCTLCLEEGVTPKKKNLIFIDEQTIENEAEYKQCKFHPEYPAKFYCEDCAEFICCVCFATNHRNHSCSTPELIVKTIQDHAQELYNSLLDLKNKIEQSTEKVQKMDSFYTEEKTNFKNTLNSMNTRILNALTEKQKMFNNEIESFFNGVDNEVEISIQKLDNTRKKATIMLEKFTKMQEEVNDISSDKKICLYKKEHDNVIEDNQKFLTDIQNFLKENLEKTKQKVTNEEDSFNSKCQAFKRNITAYEDSVINTIVSGIPNVCMRVRRFRRYTNSRSKYFKTDSICMLTSNSVNLAGFGLCGLINENSQAESYKLNLKIFELDNVQTFNPDSNPLASIDVDVPVITNIVDPVFQFYLKNSVTISKNKLYYIIITNMSNMTFINTWTGGVGKEIDDNINQHSVVCNNSSLKFNFLSAFGVESDFNEFSEGIVSDIIFSQID